MNYEEFIRNKLIKRQEPNFQQISRQLERALKDLKAAQANLKIDLTWTLAIAYHSMIRAGKALMYAKGYLPSTIRTHKTIVELTNLILGDDYHALVSKLNRMRRRRHDFIYDSKNHTTLGEANSAIQAAKKLINRIITLVREENPEKGLFDFKE